MAKKGVQSLYCICHDPGSTIIDSVVRPFHVSTWETFLRSVGVWQSLVGTRAEIAKSFVSLYGGYGGISTPQNAGFHRRCYQYFTDSIKQQRGLAAKKKLEAAPKNASTREILPEKNYNTWLEYVDLEKMKEKNLRPKKRGPIEKKFGIQEALKSFNILLNGKYFECKKCGVKLNSRASVPAHLRRHLGSKRFSCLECKAKFYSKGDLTRHLKSHFGLSEFQCHECDKRYTRKCHLTAHIRKIHLKRPYPQFYDNGEAKKNSKFCTICKKDLHADSVRNHIRMHTGEKPYLCLHCKKVFADCSSLRQHMSSHLKKGQVFCRSCQKIFTGKSELEGHVALKHGGRNHYHLYSEEELEELDIEVNYNLNSRSNRSKVSNVSQNALDATECDANGGRALEGRDSSEGEISSTLSENEIKSEPISNEEYFTNGCGYSSDPIIFNEDFQDVEIKVELIE